MRRRRRSRPRCGRRRRRSRCRGFTTSTRRPPGCRRPLAGGRRRWPWRRGGRRGRPRRRSGSLRRHWRASRRCWSGREASRWRPRTSRRPTPPRASSRASATPRRRRGWSRSGCCARPAAAPGGQRHRDGRAAKARQHACDGDGAAQAGLDEDTGQGPPPEGLPADVRNPRAPPRRGRGAAAAAHVRRARGVPQAALRPGGCAARTGADGAVHAHARGAQDPGAAPQARVHEEGAGDALGAQLGAVNPVQAPRERGHAGRQPNRQAPLVVACNVGCTVGSEESERGVVT